MLSFFSRQLGNGLRQIIVACAAP